VGRESLVEASMDEQRNLVSLNVDVGEVKALLRVVFSNQVQPLLGAAMVNCGRQ
jgi:hypothetical protein